MTGGLQRAVEALDHRHDRRVDDVLDIAREIQVVYGLAESECERSDSFGLTETRQQLAGGQAVRRRRKDQHVGRPFQLAEWEQLLLKFSGQGRVGLHLAIDGQRRVAFANDIQRPADAFAFAIVQAPEIAG